jgi:acyl-CoA synthetase (AMP-forming)/AMP-acid ligase II
MTTLLSLISDDASIRAPEDAAARSGKQVKETAESLGDVLHAAGIGTGDRVALALPNGPEFVELLLAVTGLGAGAAPLNPAYTTDEYTFYLADLAPQALVVPTGEGAAAREAAARHGTLVLEAELLEGEVILSDVQQRSIRAADRARASSDDVALLLHTSGTTSRPKQVPLLHRNLVSSAHKIAEHYALTHEDVSFAVMPLFHVHGLVASVLAQLSCGGSVIAPRRLSARVFWETIPTGGVTWFSASPTLLSMLLDERPADAAPSRLRFVRSCSAPLSSQLAERIEDALSVPLVQAYGMTEASHQIASNPLPPRRRDPHSVGLATGIEVMTVDEHGRVLPAGSPGEVVIRGDGMMPGYLDNPEANAAAFVDGWFRTGDRGVVDEEGYLTLEGRIKELIIRGGENISPYEIEDVLKRHEAVVDAACFAVPDAKYGEVVGAAVVLAHATDATELRAFCRDRLASFKVPREIHPVDSLPRTATGKVQRQQLARDLA